MEKILLIVDDSKEIIDVVKELLAESFDQIITAESVEVAQDRLNENVFSCIVLDINLEGRNGAEVVKYLVERPENKNNACPVVILGGSSRRNLLKNSGNVLWP